MKSLSVSLLFVAGAVATMMPNSQSAGLKGRSEFCGYDTNGNGWSCLESGDICCWGDQIIGCMPVGYSCCTTGFYCKPDETCLLNTKTGVQNCISNDADATRTADSSDAGETGSKSDDDDDDDDDSAASIVLSTKTWALLPVLGAMVAWL
ncbi:hypothetical protein QQX98_007690 [Neonectria punicea]|uniref:Uncharacterized protein n=1 Tax=Neonectria punicea TaxID=979145 RepID=A0ABR1GXE2_9HYPO